MARTHAQSPETVISLMKRSPSTLLEDVGVCEGVSEISKGLNWALSPLHKVPFSSSQSRKSLTKELQISKINLYYFVCRYMCGSQKTMYDSWFSPSTPCVWGWNSVKPGIRGPLPSEHLMNQRICLFSDKSVIIQPWLVLNLLHKPGLEFVSIFLPLLSEREIIDRSHRIQLLLHGDHALTWVTLPVLETFLN